MKLLTMLITGVINFWECCSNGSFAKLQTKIKNTLHSEYYYNQAKKILNKPCKNKIDFAWAFWVVTIISFSSDMQWANFKSGNEGKQPLQTLDYRRRFTTAIHDRLKLVEIFCRDAIALIKLKDGKDTFFYFDPPYRGRGCRALPG